MMGVHPKPMAESDLGLSTPDTQSSPIKAPAENHSVVMCS